MIAMDSTPRPHNDELDRLEQALEEALHVVRQTPREGLTAIEWLESAAHLGSVLAEARDASAKVRQSLLGSARTALLLYLRGHVGEAVPPHALEGVAAIREWPRRIRELRSPFGWQIESGTYAEDLRNDEYRLAEDQLGHAAAMNPDVIKAIRGQNAKERLLEYLIHLSPWPAGPQQLQRVAGTPTWRQDIRELVDDGWLIRSYDEEPDLAPGSYRLAKLED